MATGYEDWISYRVREPSTALARLEMHITALQEIALGARIQADGVIYDPATLMNMLNSNGFLIMELNRLSSVVHGVGKPRLIPTRRVDGGTLTPQGPGFSG